MCGIVGSFGDQVDEKWIEDSLEILKHRGPDNSNFKIINAQVIFGATRLSMTDPHPRSNQPFYDLITGSALVFNGEIYNYKELKENLQEKGCKFVSETDSEVLLALYAQKGVKMLDDLDGMFSFCIWDEIEETLFCARDRFGEKPFYYFLDDGSFYFGSEMKALFTLGVPRQINLNRVYNYMVFSTIEDPNNPSETFFKNIYSLEPATYLLIKNGVIKTKEKYWELKRNDSVGLTYDESCSAFYRIFEDSVKLRMRSDVPLGSSLSGGLDSSSIVSVINKLLDGGSRQYVFSARFPGFEKDEGKYIELVLKYLNKKNQIISHEVFPSESSFLENFQTLMYHQEEPFGSSSIFAQFEVMKLASKNAVKVLLDGQGADELLAGYLPFYNSYLINQFFSNPLKYLREKNKIENVSGYKAEIFNLNTFLKMYFTRYISEKGNFRRRNLNPKSSFFKGLNEEFISAYQGLPNTNPFHKNLKQHSKYALTVRGINELLRYADRNSMANSVEVRLPFLSHHLVEFVFSLPDEFLIRNGWTKSILRQSMQGIIPSEIQWRKDKIGYEPPQHDWLKSHKVKDLIMDSFNFIKSEKIVSNFHDNYSWQYLMIGMLYHNK